MGSSQIQVLSRAEEASREEHRKVSKALNESVLRPNCLREGGSPQTAVLNLC